MQVGQSGEEPSAPPERRSGLGVARVQVAVDPATVPIRLVQLRLRAGATGFVTELEPDDGGIYEVPMFVIQELGIEPQWLLAMRVKGDSMKPMMFDKEVVLVSRKHVEPIDGRIYAFSFDGEALIKQLIQKGKEWYLHSFNHKWPDINTRSGQCDIVGEVVYQAGRSIRDYL